MKPYMKMDPEYKNHWIVFINGVRVGRIWFQRFTPGIPGEGDTFMHGDFESWIEEEGRWYSWHGTSIGWNPEYPPNRLGRRNGESKARMRYRVLEWMVAESRTWENPNVEE